MKLFALGLVASIFICSGLEAKAASKEKRAPSSMSEFERGYIEGKQAGLDAGDVIADVRLNSEGENFVLKKLDNQCMGGHVTKVSCKDVDYHPVLRICTAFCVR